MNFSKFFIDRPIFAAVLSVIIFVAGLLSIFALPISEYPDVVPPSVVVRAQYPGANPKIIAETVAAPLEEQINGIEGMLYMSSQSTSDGALALTVNTQGRLSSVEEFGAIIVKTGDENDDRQDGCEDRPVDEEAREVHFIMSRLLQRPA